MCTRCGSTIASPRRATRRTAWTAGLALLALVCFLPAALWPMLEIERFGQRSVSSLLGGTLDLLRHGEWFVGGMVLVFSILFPLGKILLLLELSLLRWTCQQHRAVTYRVMEWLGRWSMLDVLLLALLVMIVKLGSLLTFKIGPAAYAFVLCVASSMAATASFDPHGMWDSG